MRCYRITVFLFFIFSFVFNSSAVYCQDFEKVEITAEKVAGNVFMLQGKGGNIGACVGDDAVFLVDDQFAPLTEKIKFAISKISNKKIRFVINTHWHYDHVGGNENLGDAGAAIVAHENVRYRMSTDQVIAFFNAEVPASPKAALPIITFSRDIRFYLNGEEIHIFHEKNAHTDGDAVVFFKKSNVIHTGDIYFSGIYPFIDLSSHGSIDGIISAAKHILSIINENTKIIPGHGPMSNKSEFTVYIEMLETLRNRVREHISNGKTLKEIHGLRPSKEFDAVWGDGFLTPDKFVQILYEDLSRSK
ncbi:MAG: MBL fold metallo-hydrolase [Deltaproteobacteria bacterium]|nr:MBL fold metallo-hydrolase [Deltaproteobacteria bacterium]